MQKQVFSALLLAGLATFSTGCAGVVAGGVAAVVVSQEMLDNNTYVSHVNQDVTQVWPTAKVFLAEQSQELIETDDQARVARADVDGAKVSISVEAYDLDKSIVRVAAKRYGVNDGDLARIINERFTRRLESSASR
jgi:hypothetical protein